ncbi:MAG TPA: thiamine phosphate synthase [Chitinophaga sp.]
MVVTHPVLLKEEAGYINALFEAGLERLHLRKPNVSEAAVRALMDQVAQEHYPKIAWHQWHHLAIRYGTKRLHFPEWMRLRHRTPVWKLLKAEGCILSTSVHAHTAAPVLPDEFSYAFAGPVFNSISKAGYRALEVNAGKRLLMAHSGVERVAIGGIGSNNCQTLKALGIRSIAISGAIWQHGAPLQAFKKLQAIWNTTAPSF